MEWYHVYLFTRLDAVNVFIGVLLAVAITIAIVVGIFWLINADMSEYGEEYSKKAIIAKNILKKIIPITAAIGLTMVFIPTQKEVAAIYLLPKLANSDFTKEASKLPTDAAKLMRLKLESWIADMEPKKAK